MRFLFEFGGRTGCQNFEALADCMESLEMTRIAAFGQKQISLRDEGNLMIEFSPNRSGAGEVFRTYLDYHHQWILARARGQTLRDLAAIYWAEGEAMAIERATGAGETKPPRPTL